VTDSRASKSDRARQRKKKGLVGASGACDVPLVSYGSIHAYGIRNIAAFLGAQPAGRLCACVSGGARRAPAGQCPGGLLAAHAGLVVQCTQHACEVRLGIWMGFVCVWRGSVHGTSAHLLFSLKGCFCVLMSLLKIETGEGTLGGWRLPLTPGHAEPGEQPPFRDPPSGQFAAEGR